MSESEKSTTERAGSQKWDWSNPQTVLALIGIVAGLAGSVFGVAMAAPYGQDLLCKTFGVSCPRTEFSNPQLSVNVIDFDSWCQTWLDEFDTSEPPPPGFTGSRTDCSLDFSVSEPADHGGNISYARLDPSGQRLAPETPGGVQGREGLLLVLHLSMEHPAVISDTPFTLRVLCRRSEPGARSLAPIPCTLSPPRYSLADPFGSSFGSYSWGGEADDEGIPLPEGAVRALLKRDELDFIARWRLDVDGLPNAALQPGHYTVEIAAGAPGEPVEPVRLGAEFEVFPQN